MTRARLLLIASGALLVLPAGASAATLEADDSCYFNGRTAELVGTGFAPESPVTFTENGRPLDSSVTSDASGAVAVTYEPPRASTERRLVIRATDEQGTTARTKIHVTRKRRVTADPKRSSNVRRWRAVFSLFGFGRGKAYVHYVNPSGKVKKTVRLGRLRGPCGRLKTDRRRVLPFKRPQFGVWQLQFDTHRRFDRDTPRRRVVPVRVFRG